MVNCGVALRDGFTPTAQGGEKGVKGGEDLGSLHRTTQLKCHESKLSLKLAVRNEDVLKQDVLKIRPE